MTTLSIINQVGAKENNGKILCVCGLHLSLLRSYTQRREPFLCACLTLGGSVRQIKALGAQRPELRQSIHMQGAGRNVSMPCEVGHLCVKWTRPSHGIFLQEPYDLVLGGLQQGVLGEGCIHSACPSLAKCPSMGDMQLQDTRLDWDLTYWKLSDRGNERQRGQKARVSTRVDGHSRRTRWQPSGPPWSLSMLLSPLSVQLGRRWVSRATSGASTLCVSPCLALGLGGYREA